MKSSTDIFPFIVDQPGANIDSSIMVTADRPLDAKEVASSWQQEDRVLIDEELVYEGLKIYSQSEKVVYICTHKPETAQSAGDCTWDVLYSKDSPSSIREYDYYKDAVDDIHNLATGQLVVIKHPTNDDNTDGSYIVINSTLLRIDNRYMYGKEFNGDSTTTNVGGVAKGTKLSSLIAATEGGDISRILDKILFAPSAPAVVLKVSRSSEDEYHMINTNIQVDQKADDYGLYFSTNPDVREWTFSSVEYVPDRMYIHGELTDIDAITKYDFVNDVIDIADYNEKCSKRVVEVSYEDYLSNPSSYGDLSNTVIHISKEYLDSIGGMSEGLVVIYNAIVRQLKDNQGYHFVAYAGSKSLYNKTYQTITTKEMVYATPQVSFAFAERTTSSDPVVGSFNITVNEGSGTIYPTGGYNYHVDIYEYINGNTDVLIAQIGTNSTEGEVQSSDFIPSKKFELSSRLDSSKGYINESHPYYAKLRVSFSYPGVGVRESTCSSIDLSIEDLRSIYAIDRGTYTGSNIVEKKDGILTYKYTFNRENEDTDYVISYGVVVVEGSIPDTRVSYDLGEERSRSAEIGESYSTSLYVTSIKIKNDETELAGSSIDSKYLVTAKSPVMSGPVYTITANASKGSDGKVQITDITVTGSDNDSLVGGYTVKLNDKVLTSSVYKPGDTISDQVGLDFGTDYTLSLVLNNVSLNGKVYEGQTTFNSPIYNVTPGEYEYRYTGDTTISREGNVLVANYKFEGNPGDYTVNNFSVSVNDGETVSYELGSSIAISGVLFNTTYDVKLYGDVNGVNTLLSTGSISQKALEKPSANNIGYTVSSDYDHPILSNPSVVIVNSDTMSFVDGALTYDYVLTYNSLIIENTGGTWSINYNTEYTLSCYATGVSIDGSTSINNELIYNISVIKAAVKPTATVLQINGKDAVDGRVETPGVSAGNVVSSIAVGIQQGSGSYITIDVSKDSTFNSLNGSTTVEVGTTETAISISDVTTSSSVDCQLWIRVYDNVTLSSSANITSGVILFTYEPPVVKEEFYAGVIEDKDSGFGEDCFNYNEYGEETPILTDSTPERLEMVLDEWVYYSPSSQCIPSQCEQGFLYVVVPSINYKVSFAVDVAGNRGEEITANTSNIPFNGNNDSIYYYIPTNSDKSAIGEAWNENTHTFIKISKIS